MDLISFVIVIVVLGLVWYLLTTFVPLPPAGKTVVTVVFVVVLILLLLQIFGIGNIRIGR